MRRLYRLQFRLEADQKSRLSARAICKNDESEPELDILYRMLFFASAAYGKADHRSRNQTMLG